MIEMEPESTLIMKGKTVSDFALRTSNRPGRRARGSLKCSDGVTCQAEAPKSFCKGNRGRTPPELARPVSSESGVVVASGRLNSSELSLILIS